MNPFSLGIALCLLLLGCVLLVYLSALLIAPITSLFKGTKGSSRIKKGQHKLDRVDQLIHQQKLAEAIRLLRKAPILEATQQPATVEAQKEHHQNILSRCLIIAEELSSRPQNIAEVERLFYQRAELQLLQIKAIESFKSLRFRREKAGKEIPSWSKSDFERRIVEIRNEIRKNESDLEAALERLFNSLSSPQSENIVYH